MASISLKGITKRFGAIEVLHGIDIEVEDGEFVVLVGPSGCGKSTLLRMIAGLEGISGGDLQIGGKRVNGMSSKDRDIAMVFQNYALYPHMTVAQNMGFSMKLRGAPKAEIETAVKRAAEILALTDYLERHPRHLSGGQRQRVAMGRAIVRDPAVFLFDEPLSNLDAKLRVSMRAEIKELHQRLNITTVYVTHDQVEAMTMADRIVVMQGGRVEQIGRPLDLYDRPDNLFVASFIGSPAMNLIPGRLEGSGSQQVFRCDGGGVVTLGGRAVNDQLLGRPLVLGIRPEDIELADPRAENATTGQVTIVEPMGAETHVTMTVGGVNLVGAFRNRIAPQPRAHLSFAVNADRFHLFDKDSGTRVDPVC